MSDGAHPSWLSLLDDKRSALSKQGCDPALPFGNEETFRTAFESIPDVRRDSKRPRLCANVLRSSRNIREFTAGLRHAAQPALSGDLTTLVWASTIRVVEAACRARVKLDIVLKLLNELNGVVPRFTTDLCRFRLDEAVQRPLQNLFIAYIDLYIAMIATFSANGAGREFDPTAMRPRIEETATQFSALATAYEEALTVAEAAEQKEKDAQARRLAREAVLDEHSFLPHGIRDSSSDYNNVRAHFKVVRRLGHGSFGEVTEVRESTTGEVYARKQIHLREGSSTTDVTMRDVENEVKIMQRLHHDHIATVSFFIKEDFAYSIMMRPVADCDLLHYLETCIAQNYPIAMTKKIYPWFGCILHALDYAHRLDIKHRDIKPGNILIKGSEPYLADFGVAKDFSRQDMSASSDYFVKGTPAYRAPEARSEEPSGRKADVFALGCVYSEMLTVIKRRTLKGYQDFRRAEGSTSRAYAFRSNLPKVDEWIHQLATASDGLSELLVDQILAMLKEDPEQRPTARVCVRELRMEVALFCDIHQ